MTHQPAYTDRADAWLAGQLSPAELQQFEQERRDDPALEAHCQYLLHLRKAQEDASAAQFAATLRGIEGKLQDEGFFDQKPQPTPAFRPLARRALAVTAALLVIVAAAIWWRSDQQQAADAARQIVPAVLLQTPLPQAAARGPRLGAGPAGSLRDSLLRLAQAGQYLAAAEGWKAEYGKDLKNPEPQVRFQWAVAQMKAGQPDPQHPSLDLLSQLRLEQEEDPERFANISLLKEDLYWYLALALLTDGQPGEAKHLLKKISTAARQQEAASLLEKIK